ncbi:hypothetical protein GZ77_23010 [Endozoicomonas montiporae]|uniref:Uncharacterized protein n=2 Tax=Endozoicomonas montiporae TaxID=1027273 RepID=A0A081N0K1_9GAMM|nr:hypothetical protein [Endozoicomonas montiporae]AMO54436.1 hypothetical protein EZMO1_0166 [Endozoicomonas montiporae CL-33]KEQ11974.1 hypothetical protein GZ77_23010 [Endozoicomonas montiporae]
MEPGQFNPGTSSATGYSPQLQTKNSDNKPSGAVKQPESTQKFMSTAASAKAVAGKGIEKRRSQRTGALIPKPYQKKELLRLAFTSNHPDTQSAIENC